MRGRSRIWGIALAIACVMLVPDVASAKTYRFKVDLTIFQDTDWTAHHVRLPPPGEGYCNERDVHYVYKSSGLGQLKAKITGARVAFTGTRRYLQSSEIKVPGTVLSDADPYTVEMVGFPDEGCDVPPPPDPSAFTGGGCHPLIRHRGTARSFLLALKGRLNLTGGFYRRDKQACSDPSLYTGVLGYGGRPSRRDVNDLIANKRVRSIELSASHTDTFTAKNLSSFGAATETIFGSGKGKARWNVKLTRIR